MRRLVLVAMTLFFLVTGGFVVWENYHKPRLMVLHSYGLDYVWTKDVNEGLNRVLGKNYWLTVRYHYLHTNLFHSRDELRRASLAARQAVEQFRPDVLLAIDDHAQELVGKYYVNDPDMPRTIQYSQTWHKQNWADIQAIVTQIDSQLAQDEWPKTDDLSACRQCAYRAYCGRQTAGETASEEPEEEISDTDLLLEPSLP